MINVKILDACCGSKMFWFNKNEPHTTYMDNRSDFNEYRDRDYIRSVVVNPDIVADFRKMPFEDNTFDLVVFDPPHLVRAGENSWLKMKYGVLPEEDWQDYIKKGFDECMRVLKPTGTLLFKWSNNQIEFNQVFQAIGRKPILGDRRGEPDGQYSLRRKDENYNKR